MAKINEEIRNGIIVRYVNAQDGIKLYLLPNIPNDAGIIKSEKNFDLEGAVSKFDETKKEEIFRIGKLWNGRQLDAMSILLYARDKGELEKYIEVLKNKPKDFDYIHPELMLARNDVSAYFFNLYVELGAAPKEVADRAQRQLEQYGVGVLVYPK